ncbi:hypothetical protein [Arthrobacter sp. 18067]|uniref:hypothetical protein n=1 Tax=Arthrobacter sp. 18067 TaxID=2681413 RepID=UPI00135A0D37|nr:hypothetical protein [Arthrobacter sp. 18067]
MNDRWLARLITKHLGIEHPNRDQIAGIRSIAEQLNPKDHPGMENMVDADGARDILGLRSVGSLRVTMSRDKAFPAPAITGPMWRTADIEQYRDARETRNSGSRGRPPVSAQRRSPADK